MKQASCGGVVPYCPGAARVEAGGNFPMESGVWLLPPSRATPSAWLYAKRALAYHWYLLLPVLCLRWDNEAGVSSPGARLGY